MQVRVQGLPATFEWQEVKDIFNPYGALRADIVPGTDAESGNIGIVRFASAAAAEKAVQVSLSLFCMQMDGM